MRFHLPAFEDAARAALLGAAFVAAMNVADVCCFALAPPFLGGGAAVRLELALWHALTVLLGGAALGLPLAGLGRLERLIERDGKLPRWGRACGWGAVALLFGVAYYFLLRLYLERVAYRLAAGESAVVLARGFGLALGLCLAFVHWLGHLLASRRLGRLVLLVVVLGAVAGNYGILRDDFAAIHAAITWPTAVLAGFLLSGFARAAGEASRPDAGRLAGLTLLAALGAAVVTPPLGVRAALFQSPGAAAPWALANWVWRTPLPEITGEGIDAGSGAEEPAELMAAAREKLPKQPVVVLITVDAMRADILTRADFKERMPRLAELVERGAWFTRATAPGSQTALSLATLFSGKYFSQLEWRALGTGTTRYTLPYPDPSVRLPELLSAAGVRTTEVGALSYLSGETRLIGRFDAEIVLARGRQHIPSNRVAPALAEQLGVHRSGRGFFYTHLMDLHEPYTLGARAKDAPFERYLSEAEHLDRSLGVILDAIERRFRGRAYVIVSADHGEAFGEHGTTFHSKTLYEELVRVPLVIAGPRIAPQRIDAHVGLIDVGPTILHLFGIERPKSFEGRSLLPLARGLTTEVPRRLYLEGRLRRGMYLPDGRKLIEDSVQKSLELYDLASDPGELNNLFRADDPASRRALAELRGFFRKRELRRPGYSAPYIR